MAASSFAIVYCLIVGTVALKTGTSSSPCNITAMVDCKLQCNFGFRIEAGCQVCACASDPCKSLTCPSPQVCKVHDIPGLQETSAECLDRDIPEKCQQPLQQGPCMALFRNYYYDTKEHMCKEFVYGGCRGNLNRFITAAECRRVCIVEPEHAIKYPKCPKDTSRECLNFCQFGHAMKNGCPSCSCRPNPCEHYHCKEGECRLKGCISRHNCPEGEPICVPKCTSKQKCDPCAFGHERDEKGCPTCECLPDPCQSHTCPEFQKCTRSKDLDCIVSPCPYLPTCIEMKQVYHIDVQMRMIHEPHAFVDADTRTIKQKLRKLISTWLSVGEDNIIKLKVSQENKESVMVFFSVRTDVDVDLAQKYYKMKQKLYQDHTNTTLRYEGLPLTPDADSLRGKVAETDPHEEVHRIYKMSAIAAGAVCGAVGLVIVLAIIVVAVKRRRYALYRGSSNIPYKGMSIRNSVKEDRVAIM